MKTILIDMDDVIENFTEAWVKGIGEKFGYCLTSEDIKDWHIGKFYPELTTEELYSIIRDPDFWLKVEPKEDAMKYIPKLQEHFDVYLVTATEIATAGRKLKDLIEVYFPFIDEHHIIIAHNKQMVRGDYIIDDGLHNLIGHDAFKMLYDVPHNRLPDNLENKLGIYRVFSWKDIYETIMKREGLSEQISYT